MNRITSPEIPTDDLMLPSNCRFRLWSRARLEVEDRHVTLEGSHAGLMLELLRNRGRRVPAALLRASMLSSNIGGDAVEDDICMEIRRIRYTLAANGIHITIDDSEPEEGFMLSALFPIPKDFPDAPSRRKTRTRRTQKTISGSGTERKTFTPGHSADCPDVPYSVPERHERRTIQGGRNEF